MPSVSPFYHANAPRKHQPLPPCSSHFQKRANAAFAVPHLEQNLVIGRLLTESLGVVDASTKVMEQEEQENPTAIWLTNPFYSYALNKRHDINHMGAGILV